MTQSLQNNRRPVLQDTLGLFVYLMLCFGVAAIGGAITATSVDTWYPTLHKPVFNPPAWLFAPVWSTLYLLMAISAWRVWRRSGRRYITQVQLIFLFQLLLNLTWSLLFFGLQRIDLALIEIIILLVTIVFNAFLFWRIDPIAGWLFVPYISWVSFATVLNLSLFVLN